MEAYNRASLRGTELLTCLQLLEFLLLLQYGQTPQAKLLIAFHLWTPSHPHAE